MFPLNLSATEKDAVARMMHAASTVNDLLVITGGVNLQGTRCNIEVFEPGNGSIARVDPANVVGATFDADCPVGHAQVTLLDGTVAIIGGVSTAPGGMPDPAAEPLRTIRFWSTSAGFQPQQQVDMFTGRFRHRAGLLANGSVLIVGGEVETGAPQATANAEMLSLEGLGFQASDLAGPPLDGRADLALEVLPNNQVFISGGYIETTGTTSDRAELYFGD